MLLDCEEIVEEHRNWRVVNEEILNRPSAVQHTPVKMDTAAGPSSAAAHEASGSGSLWREELSDRQDSQPPGAVQRVYAHASWIPLARDWGGNNLAVDLAPGPAGKWGQVILFGRDYDCKYVVARSWAALLAMLADDICSGKVQIDEETNEMRLNAFRNASPPYFEILRWRSDQKFGRRQPRRRHHPQSNSSKQSPYGSPTPSEERTGGQASPSSRGIRPLLARVAEDEGETSAAVNGKEKEEEDLMEISTPVKGDEKKNKGTDKMEDKAKDKVVIDDKDEEMKNVMI